MHSVGPSVAGAAPMASLHDGSHRERDPLRRLHYQPFPWGQSGPDPEPRRTWLWVPRMVWVARLLAKGSLGSPAGALQLGSERGTRPPAAGLQEKIVQETWDMHAARAVWGSISDGRAYLRRLAPNGISGYGTAAVHTSGKFRTADLRKGDQCPLWADDEASPPPGTTPGAFAAWSLGTATAVQPWRWTVLGAGEACWYKHDGNVPFLDDGGHPSSTTLLG